MAPRAIDLLVVGDIDVAAGAADRPRHVDGGCAQGVDLARRNREEGRVVDTASCPAIPVAAVTGRAGVAVPRHALVAGVGGERRVTAQTIEIAEGTGDPMARVALHRVRSARDGKEARSVLFARELCHRGRISAVARPRRAARNGYQRDHKVADAKHVNRSLSAVIFTPPFRAKTLGDHATTTVTFRQGRRTAGVSETSSQ